MPPSGYSTTQAKHMQDFLQSCAVALEAEAADKGESLVEALNREIADIERHAMTTGGSEAQIGILNVTNAFYKNVRLANPSSKEDYQQAVAQALISIKLDILAIHVPPARHAA